MAARLHALPGVGRKDAGVSGFTRIDGMGAGGERGQVAGMPQHEELFHAAEDAG